VPSSYALASKYILALPTGSVEQGQCRGLSQLINKVFLVFFVPTLFKVYKMEFKVANIDVPSHVVLQKAAKLRHMVTARSYFI